MSNNSLFTKDWLRNQYDKEDRAQFCERVRNNLIIGFITLIVIYLLILFGIKNRIWEDQI